MASRGFRTFLKRCSLVAVLAIVSGGGGDDDPVKPHQNNPVYPERSSPENVLLAYDIAYEGRDTTVYVDLFDSTYVGSSTDLNDIVNVLTFTLADEADHIRALRAAGVSVYLDFGPSATWIRMPSDDLSHPEWATIEINGSAFAVEISDGPNTYGTTGSPGTYQKFAFAPSLDTTSPTDTLWRIVRWQEVGMGP